MQAAYYFLSVLGILKRRSKSITILLISMMWLVFGLNTYNGDFVNYEWVYRNIESPAYWAEFEPLFNVIMYVCHRLGLDFIQFRMVFGGLYIGLLVYVISKFTDNIAEVLGFYMIFPFLYFVSVMRSGFASLFIILAFYEITSSKRGVKKFWIYIITATMFQYTSLMFSAFCLFKRKNLSKILKVIIPLIISIIFFLYYSGYLYAFAGMFITNYRILKWFSAENNNQKLIWSIYLIVIDLIIILFSYAIRVKERNIFTSDDKKTLSSDIFDFNIYTLVLIPAFFISNACARIIWQVLLLNIINVVVFDEHIQNKDFKSACLEYSGRPALYFSSRVFILTCILVVFAIYANLPYRNTINDAIMLFKNNLLVS